MFIFGNFCLSCFLFVSAAFLTPNISLLNLADQFFYSGNYDEAITEYKRFIFFSPQSSGSWLGYAYYKIALAYRNQQSWEECFAAFQQSIQTEVREDIRDERKIALAIALISSGNYSEAEFTLLKVEMFTAREDLRHRAAFFRGISAVYSSKWDEAREAFRVYFGSPALESGVNLEGKTPSNGHRTSSDALLSLLGRGMKPSAATTGATPASNPLERLPAASHGAYSPLVKPTADAAEISTKVDILLAEARNFRPKSPGLAKALSTFLPGSGQIYAADLKNGLNAFLLNSATAYLLFRNLQQKDILDALFNSLFLFERFYSGNRENAEEAAQRYNQRFYRKFAEDILKTLEKRYHE